MTPASGYHIASVLVDGVALLPAPSSYTFSNVTADHSIAVTFSNAAASTTELSLYSSASRVRLRKSVTLSGALDSFMDLPTVGLAVRYEVKKPGASAWTLMRSCITNVFGASHASMKLTKVGTYRFRARFLGTEILAASDSPVVRVVARR
jgi:hypothetical protein